MLYEMIRFAILVVLCITVHSVSATNQVTSTRSYKPNGTEQRPTGLPWRVGQVGRAWSQGPPGPPGPPGPACELKVSETWLRRFEELRRKNLALEHAAHLREARSCKDHLNLGNVRNGIYEINIPGLTEMVPVYCDQETDGGGWLVFQRRENGSVNFYRTWNDYQFGFGNIRNEFWLGLELLYKLTTSNSFELRINMEDFEGGRAYAKYINFQVGAATDLFRLTVSDYSGNAGDGLTYHNGQQFSTSDKGPTDHCARKYTGAWWYKSCYESNLNGQYLSGDVDSEGVTWHPWKHSFNSLKWVEMKLRPN